MALMRHGRGAISAEQEAENSAELIRTIGANIRYSDKKSSVRAVHNRELEIAAVGWSM